MMNKVYKTCLVLSISFSSEHVTVTPVYPKVPISFNLLFIGAREIRSREKEKNTTFNLLFIGAPNDKEDTSGAILTFQSPFHRSFLGCKCMRTSKVSFNLLFIGAGIGFPSFSVICIGLSISFSSEHRGDKVGFDVKNPDLSISFSSELTEFSSCRG